MPKEAETNDIMRKLPSKYFNMNNLICTEDNTFVGKIERHFGKAEEALNTFLIY